MVIEFILIFMAAAFISFIGSLQPGPVNMQVLHVSYNYNLKSAVLVAAGGVLPEIVYAAMAIWFSVYFMMNPYLLNMLQWMSIPFFFVSGLVLIYKKTTAVNLSNTIINGNLLLKGFFAGLFNPMLFAFWLMVINFFSYTKIFALHNFYSRVAFIAGAAIGAFGLLLLFALLTIRNKEWLDRMLAGNINRITGLVFIIFAGVAVIRLLS
jgi:threonine/homoserine/homoserine lactone efflux protein